MLASLFPKDVREATHLGHTTEDAEVWFSTLGSDDTGDGSAAHPYATYDRAMASVPYNIDHRVIVKCTAGTYHSTRHEDARHCSQDGQFILECADPPVTVAGPFTLTATAGIGKDPGVPAGGWLLTVAGAGWVPDAFYRKFIRLTNVGGYWEHCCFPIFSNAAASMKIAGNNDVPPSPADTFVVVEPAATIIFDRAPTFIWDAGGDGNRSYFGVANVSFQVPDMDPAVYGIRPFTWRGNAPALLGLVEFYGDKAWSLFEQSAGIINVRRIGDVSQMADPWLIQEPANAYATATMQFAGTVAPPTAASVQQVIAIAGHNNHGWSTGMYSFSCRQGVVFDTPRGLIQWAYVANASIDHHSKGQIQDCCVCPVATAPANAIRVDDNSFLDVGNVWIDQASGDAILCTDLSRMIIADTGGTKLSIAGYGLKVGACCQIKVEGGTDLEGVTGKVRFDQSASTENWPTAKTAKTDSLGSFVVG